MEVNIKENNMKVKRKKCYTGTLVPNIERGGSAIPLGNNIYWMKGRTHAKGGIDIGKDLEVENNEVMQMLPNETRVFSSIPFLGGNSPAQLVASGFNPDIVFNAQEQYKKVNRIKDDGTKYKKGGKKPIGGVGRVGTPLIVPSIAFQSRGNKNTSLNMNSEEKVLSMANYVRPKNNYEDAVDSEPSAWFPWKNFANKLGLPHSGLSNCTLTASQLYNPARPINHARTITSNPRANGFYEVGPEHAVPGSMVIASNNLNDKDMKNTYHTMILTGYADKDYKYNFAGNEYDIKKGTPLVSYSRGGNNVGDWRTNIPIDVYLANGEGKNVVRYYRPLDKNGNENVLLDEITVTPKKYGGMTNNMNLQNIQHNSLTNSNRTISPNKIGTIVRIDGNGKDKLNYIPSTGSSQQVMKGGGRAKAFVGIKYPFMRYLVDDGTIPERTHITDGADDYPVRQRTTGPIYENNLNNYVDLINSIAKDQSDIPGYVSAGVNVLGSVINGLIANNALNKQHAPVRPIPKIAQKFKTKYNINPQVSSLMMQLASAKSDAAKNTASSHTLRNLYNQYGIASLDTLNKLYGEKENKETELINQDIANRQTVDHENVDTYNKWIENLTNFYNNKSLLKAQNWAQMVNGIGTGIGQGIRNYGASKRYRDNLLIAMLPYIKATGVDTV